MSQISWIREALWTNLCTPLANVINVMSINPSAMKAVNDLNNSITSASGRSCRVCQRSARPHSPAHRRRRSPPRSQCRTNAASERWPGTGSPHLLPPSRLSALRPKHMETGQSIKAEERVHARLLPQRIPSRDLDDAQTPRHARLRHQAHPRAHQDAGIGRHSPPVVICPAVVEYLNLPALAASMSHSP